MNNLKNKYFNLFGFDGLTSHEIKNLESCLSVNLPPDLVDILSFFSANRDIASLSLFSFDIKNDLWNVCEKTQFFRKQIKLPNNYIVLKEGDESFIVLDIQDDINASSPVLWLSSTDACNLAEGKPLLDNPIKYETFADFFEFLLDEEEAARAEE